jgi:hypothetical protein
MLTEKQMRIRELRHDCMVRRDWIRSGRWDRHPSAISDWRAEIKATEASIERLETGDYPEGTPLNYV